MSNGLVRHRSPEDDVGPRPSKYFKSDQPESSKIPTTRVDGGTEPLIAQSSTMCDGKQKSLQELLDLTNIASPDFPLIFAEIAEALIQRSRLKVECNGVVTTYQVIEIEFYLMDPERHPDPFTHGENEQGVSGRWYFHRAPRSRKPKEAQTPPPTTPTGYRGGTRKGLDLTFGGPLHGAPTTASNDKSVRGGILLRSLLREHDDKIISGPSLLVDEVLRQSKVSTLVELVNDKWQKDSGAFKRSTNASEREAHLYFAPHSATAGSLPVIYSSPRIGLDLSNTMDQEDRITFVDRHYRYFTHPHRLVSNGRGQTFVGLWRHLRGGVLDPTDVDRQQFPTLSGMAAGTVESYIGFYTAGQAKAAKGRSSLKEYLGASGKGVCASNGRLLAMLGLLERLRSDGEDAS